MTHARGPAGSSWPGVRRAFHLPGSRRRVRDEIDAELDFHLAERIDELVAAGMTREQAAAEVRARFGDLNRIGKECEMVDRETYRRREWRETLHSLGRETRQALRTLARAPGFTAVSVLALALGIGATTSVFTLLDAVVLRPLPYRAAQRLVYLESAVPGLDATRKWGLSVAGYFHFSDSTQVFEAIGAYAGAFGDSYATVIRPSGAERVPRAAVTASVMDVFGAQPAAGRLIQPADDKPGADGVVVLGHDYWMRGFGGDRGVIGSSINIGGQLYTVIGVMRDGVHLPDQQVDLWMPMRLDPAARPVNSHWLRAAARLKPGVSIERASADVRRLTAQFPALFPSAYDDTFMRQAHFGTDVVWLRDKVVGDFGRRLWILLGSVSLVLVIACANVANLFLVRAEGRRREVAVRTALGAERAHLASHYLTESMLLTLIGAAAGVWLAHAAIRLLLTLAPAGIPRLSEVGIDWRSVTFAVGVAIAAGVVFGLFPVLRHAGDFTPLREAARGSTPSARQHATRNALVVGQVALALVLLAAAGLMLQSFRHLRRVDPGFRPHGVLTVDVSLPYSRYGSYEKVGTFYRELFTRLAALPGVSDVGGTTRLPLTGAQGCSSIFREDRPVPAGEEPPCVPTPSVAPGYFRTLGIPVRGRENDWGDFDRRGDAVVVTRALAERLWPGQDPIGKGVKGNGDGPPYYRVAGVAGDVRDDGLELPPLEAVYFPMRPMEGAPLWSPPAYLTIVVRTTTAEPTRLAPAVRRTVAQLDPEVPVANVRTMDEVVERSTSRTSFTMLLLAVAGGIALILSAVGIFGVISYVVGQRRGEIGIRMALGARAAQVARLVVTQSLRLAAAGVAIGLLGSALATRVLRSMLFGVSPTDAVTLSAAAALLVLVALAASYLPARRAARVDPVEALRGE